MNSGWKKTFYIIWTGQLFSSLSSSIVGFSVVFWLSVQSQSAQVLAYAMIAALLPQIVLGMFTGVYIDKWSRKYTMIFSDLFIAFCTGILGLLFYFGAVAIWQIYLLMVLRSVGTAFHTPAMQSSTPLLAPESELMRIAGINQVIYSLSTIGGPVLGAILINSMPMTYIMSLDVIGALIACTCLLFVTIPNPVKKASEVKHNLLAEIKEGLQAIFSRKGLKYLFMGEMGAMFFIIPVASLFPLITLQYFKGTAFDLGLVESGWGVGMLLGGVIVGLRQMKHARKAMLIAMMCMVSGICFMSSGMLSINAFYFFVVLTFIGGIAATIWNSSFTVILQTNIEPDKLGRAFSTYDSLILVPSIPGLLATGFIAENIGLQNSFVIAGASMTLIGLLIFINPKIRSLDKQKPMVSESDQAAH